MTEHFAAAGCFYYAVSQKNMTVVEITKNKIMLSGHAGYAPLGQDIVCAGISTLVYTLENSLTAYTDERVGFSYADGKVTITWQKLGCDGALLVHSFICGLTLLAESYPDNIKVQTLTTITAAE